MEQLELNLQYEFSLGTGGILNVHGGRYPANAQPEQVAETLSVIGPYQTNGPELP